MGGDNTQTTTSGMSNPELKQAVSTIGNQLTTQLGQGVKPYTESMVPALSGQTQAGIGSLTNNPNNAAYGSGISGAIGNQSQIAAGNFGSDPVRSRVLDDALAGVNSSFLTDGRFGSSAMVDEAANAATGALAQYDYGRQQQAIQNLPGLYQASMLPAGAQLQAGQLMDNWNTARAQDQARIFDATQNAGWKTLGTATSILAGTAPSAGTTTTQSQQTPWWQVPAQIGGTVLGAMF